MHYQNLNKKLITLFALFGLVFTFCSRDKGSKIVIKGSTTVLPITQKVMEDYRRINKISISLEGSGSGNGIKALIDGSADIANSSREIKDKEIEQAKAKGVNIEEIPIAYDMIIPIVHPSNKVGNITLNQLKAIFDGSISNWKELGGKDEKIIVISRDTSSGTFEYWHEFVLKKADVRKDALLQASNGQVLSTVSGNPKAIGYIGFGYLNNSVKALSVEGIVGTIENGKSKKYPISRKLYVYVNKDKVSKEAREFINYTLSAEGQKLVKEAGYIPL
jgi:phosphate transport system substrate-binding protein